MARPATSTSRLLAGSREPVRVASTSNINPAAGGLLTIDGVTVEPGDRVLLKDQADQRQNGIYGASEGEWYRASDARSPRAINKGVTVHVAEGTAHEGQTFAFLTPEPEIGHDEISIGFFLSYDTVGDAEDALQDAADAATAAGEAAVDAVEAAGEAAVDAVEAAGAAALDAVAESVQDAADSAASAALVTGALPRVNLTTLKALASSTITVAYRTDANREGFYHFRSGNYSTQVAADANEYDYIKADDKLASAGAWVRIRMGNPLGKAAVARLPMGEITLPGTFNNPLNARIYWDGSAVRFYQKPYDLIDFTLSETCNHYYVNYTTGNNANPGTTEGSPWKTWDYARVNAVSPAVIHMKDDWVGYLSAGSTAGVVFSGKFKIIGEGPTGRTRFVSMRESYDAAFFNFVASGSAGAYVSNALTSNDYYRAQFDRKYLDARGIPMPIVVAASQAACEATPGTFWWDSGTFKVYVHMIDNRKPNPADGWMYTRSAYRTELQQALDTVAGVILVENLEFCANSGAVSTAAFRYRPVTTGAPTLARMGMKNCLAYGNGNGFEIYDADVIVKENCHARYSHVDGHNYHSFVTTGQKGEFITVYEYDCSAYDNGFNLFPDQVALSASSNGSTSHDSMHIVRANVFCGDCNGAVIADVNGVHSLNYNVQAARPKGTGSPKACFWHDAYQGVGTTKKMFLWGCSAFDDGDTTVSLIDYTAQGGGQNGDIHVQYWLGQTYGKVVGPLKDFAGTVL
jgi:hypothetical protein